MIKGREDTIVGNYFLKQQLSCLHPFMKVIKMHENGDSV